MAHPILFLWTVPRSVSTSFERMMMERGDHVVFDEPFSDAYYYGPERRSPRYDERVPGCTPETVLEQIQEAAEDRPVFVKDMAYQAGDLLGPDLLGRFRNSFLVRHPAAALRSYARQWPDFTNEEGGWPHLGKAADIVREMGEPLVVLDSEVLCRDPEAVVSRWCEHMDVPFIGDALSWQPGMRSEWERWSEWHETTSRSTGFRQLRPPADAPGPDEPHLQQAYEEALPIYERLSEHAIGRELAQS